MTFKRISTRTKALDDTFGGYPCGEITHLYAESSDSWVKDGKDTLGYRAAAEAQKDSGTVVWIDYNNDFLPEMARRAGLDYDSPRFALVQPQVAEGGLVFLRRVLPSEADLVIISEPRASIIPEALDGDGYYPLALQAFWEKACIEIQRLLRGAPPDSAAAVLVLDCNRRSNQEPWPFWSHYAGLVLRLCYQRRGPRERSHLFRVEVEKSRRQAVDLPKDKYLRPIHPQFSLAFPGPGVPA